MVNIVLVLEVWNKWHGNCKLSPSLTGVQEQKDGLGGYRGLS